MRYISVIFSVFILSVSLMAQDRQIFQAKEYFKSEAFNLQITHADVENARISDAHYDRVNKAHFIYLQQTYQGVDIFNAVTAVAVSDKGAVINSGNAFVTNLETKEIISKDQYNAVSALHRVLHDQRVPIPKKVMKFRKERENYFEMPFSQIAHHPIIAEKVYFPRGDQLVLSWRIEFDSKFTGEISSVIVNAGNGEIIEELSQTLKCFDVSHNHTLTKKSKTRSTQKTKTQVQESKGDGAQYLVYPYYLESPDRGDQELVNDPSDEVASPYGWHDTDGAEGAEYTITRGNNAHAYQDKDGDNRTFGDEPDGGLDLIFDTPHDLSKDVENPNNEKADVTQLFYMGNFMHDWTYHFGFDEAAGNYQSNNYGNGGRDGDFVVLQSLDGLESGQINNANFSVSSDGRAGRMQMYNWVQSGRDVLVDGPEDVSGEFRSTSTRDFGPGKVMEELTDR